MTTKQFTLLSMALLGCGIAAMVIGGLMGGEFLDNFAGDPTDNSDLESILLYGGLLISVVGVVLLIAVLTVLVVKWILNKRSA